jgi:hypothetical protein
MKENTKDTVRKWFWRFVWVVIGFVLGRLIGRPKDSAPSQRGDAGADLDSTNSSRAEKVETALTYVAGFAQVLAHVVVHPEIFFRAIDMLSEPERDRWHSLKQRWPTAWASGNKMVEALRKEGLSDDAIDVAEMIRQYRDRVLRENDSPLPLKALAKLIDPAFLLTAPPPTGDRYVRFHQTLLEDSGHREEFFDEYVRVRGPNVYKRANDRLGTIVKEDFGLADEETFLRCLSDFGKAAMPMLFHLSQLVITDWARQEPEKLNWSPVSLAFV